MRRTEQDTKQRSKLRGPPSTNLNTRERILKGFLSAQMYDLEKELPWGSHKEFSGLTLIKREVDWLAVVKGHRRGKHYVAFVEGLTWTECLDHVHYCVAANTLRWFPDRYHSVEEP